MDNFLESEFKCKCGKCDKGFKDMKPSTLKRLETARKSAALVKSDVVFVINSAMRCVEHNRKGGGSTTSSHLTGYAVDIKINSSADRYAILFGLMTAGFTRLGIGNTFIHADDDPSKTPNVIWTY